ncbi:MAG: M3 family metallopeptidase [Muribaculaceae bacterium]|nr:M3 family metallopeptidase [Muribaculaceae bacterium]
MIENNIFFRPFNTTGGFVPFDRITTADYEPAILEGIKQHDAQVATIVENQDEPTFENTIVALERAGEMLNRVLGVFYPMLSCHASDELMAVSERMSPVLSEHFNSITLNERLWQRVKRVHDGFDSENHDVEDQMLMRETYDGFVRSGANLQGDDRERYRQLAKRLTKLTLKFDQNALKETSQYELWLTGDDLNGLPESALDAAKLAAKNKGREDEWLVTLDAPSYVPFMKYSDRRDLREKLYKMYNRQCTSGEFCNLDILRDIANTRLEIAKLMGCKSFAEYKLQHTMAETPANVYGMLNRLREAYLPVERSEMARLTEFASKLEGKTVEIMPWDYSYYSNKEKDSMFEINDELLRPYFELGQVTQGVFGFAKRMYGLRFVPNFDAQVFHPEVEVYDVTDEDGKPVGMLYLDFFPRATKQSGAWMTSFREQYIDDDGNDIRPHVTLTMNFTRPTDAKPSLLTIREVETFMHEFGHALHQLLTRCKYQSLSGTNVYRDFVEVPSQFNENYVYEREFLDSFARHYQTGEPVPQELIDKLLASSQYAAAYSCVRQLGFGFIDMAWHSITEPYEGDDFEFEYMAVKDIQAFKPVEGCIMSPQFTHIFSGGYAAGYYGYKWAEVIECDAFDKFKQDGIFNSETARSWVNHVLSRGGTEAPMALYKRFRGSEPGIEAMMRRDGIKPVADNSSRV